jgi:hypothetical protein
MGWKRIAALVLAVLCLGPAASHAEGKFSGVVFGDYYYFAQDHDSTLTDHNGFWIRRINLSWDGKLDDSYSARVRLETASPGDFAADNQAAMFTYVKDAWLKWQTGNQAVYVGLSTTPSHSFEEDFWGYRHLEKIPGELQGFYGSRDMGLAAQGKFGESKRLGYHVMVGNGTGTLNELDSRKKVSGELQYSTAGGFVVEGYADFEDRPENSDRTTFRGMAGYKSDKARAGVEYVQQTRDLTAGGSMDLRLVSGFGTAKVGAKVWIVARVDHALDAGAKAGRPYIPIDGSTTSTFILGGVEFRSSDAVTFTPNVEIVTYGAPDGGGPTPDTDIVPRITFMVKF